MADELIEMGQIVPTPRRGGNIYTRPARGRGPIRVAQVPAQPPPPIEAEPLRVRVDLLDEEDKQRLRAIGRDASIKVLQGLLAARTAVPHGVSSGLFRPFFAAVETLISAVIIPLREVGIGISGSTDAMDRTLQITAINSRLADLEAFSNPAFTSSLAGFIANQFGVAISYVEPSDQRIVVFAPKGEESIASVEIPAVTTLPQALAAWNDAKDAMESFAQSPELEGEKRRFQLGSPVGPLVVVVAILVVAITVWIIVADLWDRIFPASEEQAQRQAIEHSLLRDQALERAKAAERDIQDLQAEREALESREREQIITPNQRERLARLPAMIEEQQRILRRATEDAERHETESQNWAARAKAARESGNVFSGIKAALEAGVSLVTALAIASGVVLAGIILVNVSGLLRD